MIFIYVIILIQVPGLRVKSTGLMADWDLVVAGTGQMTV
jgi:hypothetical protein